MNPEIPDEAEREHFLSVPTVSLRPPTKSRRHWHTSAPGAGKPGPESAVQRVQSGSSGASGQHQKLMAQGQILEEQISTGFENGCGWAQQESQPAKHAPHHPTKCTGRRAFSSRMEFLPTTGVRLIRTSYHGHGPPEHFLPRSPDSLSAAHSRWSRRPHPLIHF